MVGGDRQSPPAVSPRRRRPAEPVQRHAGEEVGLVDDHLVLVEGEALADQDALLFAQGVEVGDGEEAHVGRVVPLVGQVLGDRHAPVEDGLAVAPVGEVGEADHRLAADPQHLGQDALGVAHGLQRQAHDDVVEEAVVEAGEALFHVDLDHVDAVAGAGDDALGVVLDAVAAHLAHVAEVAQQAAVAAAEVEHPLAGLDPVGDHVVVVALVAHGSDLDVVDVGPQHRVVLGSSSRKESWPAGQSISA
jgi:hypothetical protein